VNGFLCVSLWPSELALLKRFGGRAFAKHFPGTGRVNRLAVDLSHAPMWPTIIHLIAVNRAVAAHRHAQHQVAVLAHDVRQAVGTDCARIILVLVEYPAVPNASRAMQVSVCQGSAQKYPSPVPRSMS